MYIVRHSLNTSVIGERTLSVVCEYPERTDVNGWIFFPRHPFTSFDLLFTAI
jgi:hypothetical protein